MRKRASEKSLTPEEMTALAALIYKRRMQLNISQETVAQALRRARCAVSNVENGRTKRREGYEAVLNTLARIETERMTSGLRARSA